MPHWVLCQPDERLLLVRMSVWKVRVVAVLVVVVAEGETVRTLQPD